MGDCCVREFMTGGALQEVTITSSTFTTGVITASDFVSSNIKELASVDANSAQKIADTIASLNIGQLRNLAAAIARALPSAPVGNPPIQTEQEELPTAILGSREAMLGRPENWLAYKDYVIPAFKAGA